MNANQRPDPAAVVRQLSLLMPLAEAIREQLKGREFAGFRRTERGVPYVEVRTEDGSSLLAYLEDGLYALYTAGGRYACDPNGAKDAIYNAIRRALDDARAEKPKPTADIKPRNRKEHS